VNAATCAGTEEVGCCWWCFLRSVGHWEGVYGLDRCPSDRTGPDMGGKSGGPAASLQLMRGRAFCRFRVLVV